MIIPAQNSQSIPYLTTNKYPKTRQANLDFLAIQAKIKSGEEPGNKALAKTTGKYDLRNCTFDEFCATVKALAKEGKLTTHDVLLTTIDFERSFKQNPNFSFYITPSDSAGRRNWVDEFGALANRELQRGNMLGYQRHTERKEVVMKAAELLSQSRTNRSQTV